MATCVHRILEGIETIIHQVIQCCQKVLRISMTMSWKFVHSYLHSGRSLVLQDTPVCSIAISRTGSLGGTLCPLYGDKAFFLAAGKRLKSGNFRERVINGNVVPFTGCRFSITLQATSSPASTRFSISSSKSSKSMAKDGQLDANG